MSTNTQDPDHEDLEASGNEPLLNPPTGEQPRPDEVDPEEPLGAPVDPVKDDPSKIEGDPAEDDM